MVSTSDSRSSVFRAFLFLAKFQGRDVAFFGTKFYKLLRH